MKKFFGIESDKYIFEWCDVTALLTVLNVVFVLMGFWWAPILGLVNCSLGIGLNVRGRCHINMYIIQVALIILNIYFLNLG